MAPSEPYLLEIDGEMFLVRGAYRLHQLVRTYVGPAQELEQAALALPLAFDVEDATGGQLDAIGWVVGEARDGRSDVAYRAYVKARILTNTSDGSSEFIYGVARALLGPDTLSLRLVPNYPAAYDLEVASTALRFPWDAAGVESAETVAKSVADAVFRATSAGVSLTLYYQYTDDDHTFKFVSGDAEVDTVDQGFADDDDEGPGGQLIDAEERF